MTEYDYPDGSGSIGVPSGWKCQSLSAEDPTAVVGPADQTVSLHDSLYVQTPDSPGVLTQQRFVAMSEQMQRNNPQYHPTPLAPVLVAPLTDPVTAVKNLIPQLSKRSEFNHGPTLALDKIISSQDLPCQLPGGKCALITYVFTKTLNGQSSTFRTQMILVAASMQMPGAWMSATPYAVTAPDATFDRDLPIMMAIVKSEKVDQQKAAQIAMQRNQQINQMGQRALAAQQQNYQAGQQIIAAQQKQFQATNDMAKQNWQTQMDIHNQQQAQTEAGYAAHNQQFNDYELQRSRNSADFDESIIGTRTVYDTVTGGSGYANLTDVNGVVDSLNQAALDPNRFVQIPLRDQLYPVPPGK
jgi:hypothetical protein